jgi:hypothetical protein
MWIHACWTSVAVAGGAEHHPVGGVPPGGDARSAGQAYRVMAGAGPDAGAGVADNAEDCRFAEVWALYTTVKSPQSGKPPH